MSEHRNPTARRFLIHDGNDLAHLAELDEAVEKAKSAPVAPRLMSEADPVRAAVEARNEFLSEADGRATLVVLREVGRKKRREMLEACPPREGNEGDAGLGANTDLLGEALLEACIASPTFESPEARDAFLEDIGGKWYDRLTTEAFAMNFGGVTAPKALSLPSPASDAT